MATPVKSIGRSRTTFNVGAGTAGGVPSALGLVELVLSLTGWEVTPESKAAFVTITAAFFVPLLSRGFAYVRGWFSMLGALVLCFGSLGLSGCVTTLCIEDDNGQVWCYQSDGGNVSIEGPGVEVGGEVFEKSRTLKGLE